jgi:hypothetical protein
LNLALATKPPALHGTDGYVDLGGRRLLLLLTDPD